eukprot:gnl/TRDRNA2_/TRDRNA2_162079_c0_seq2.p1 gnl/TRDRNA2_/TRDRNA2_162079_c0~~gnl/TRDRNA2_/TRDRNA2_162079_c0_seq2.p1  ORF type:complete len:537 (+),score=85.45 gnl/TRDRNA2_/TRDRNA2_162079_c0_seq2:72-1682(+)
MPEMPKLALSITQVAALLACLLCVTTVSVGAMFYLDALLLDWSGRYGMQLRQGMKCLKKRLPASVSEQHATKEDPALAGHFVHGKAFVFPDTHEVVTLVLCSACNCPIGDGDLHVGDEPAQLLDVWQSGETGEWLDSHALDVFVYTWRMPLLNSAFESAGKDMLAGQALNAEEVPALSLHVQGSKEVSLEPWRVNANASVHQDAQNRSVMVCTKVKLSSRPNFPDLALRSLVPWAKHTRERLGADFIWVYVLPQSAKKAELGEDFPQKLRKILDGLRPAAGGAELHVRVAAMFGKPLGHEDKRHYVDTGNLIWLVHDCLYQSKVMGAGYMMFLDPDEYLHIGQYSSLLFLGEMYRGQEVDAITFPRLTYATDVCFDRQAMHHVVQKMRCRKEALGDCSGPMSLTFLLRGLDHLCIGSKGRRRYLIRPRAMRRLQTHSVDAAPARVKHASSGDDLYVRYYQGLEGALAGGRACANMDVSPTCKDDVCTKTKVSDERSRFHCDRAVGLQVPKVGTGLPVTPAVPPQRRLAFLPETDHL